VVWGTVGDLSGVSPPAATRKHEVWLIVSRKSRSPMGKERQKHALKK